MENIWQRAGGIKFNAFIIVTVCATLLCYLGKLDGTQYAALEGGVAGALMAANVGATFGNAKLAQAQKANPE